LQQYNERKNDIAVQKLDWSLVNDRYNQLFEWHQDRELYHLIGFIIYESIKTIAGITELYSRANNKVEFYQELKTVINKYLYKKKEKEKSIADFIDSMSYGVDNKWMQTILVLHNVVNYFYVDNYYRFPFNRLKMENGWSLEHIHAQNTDKFESIEDITEWISEIKLLAKNFEEDKSLNDSSLRELNDNIDAIRQKLTEKKVKNDNEELKSLVKSLDDKAISFFNKDSLSNLCLLDGRTNSSIGKQFFKDKRKAILEIDKNTPDEYSGKINPFIPLATKLVLLKYFCSVVHQIR
jgi:hypothetical protein